MKVDLVVTRGRVITMDLSRPEAESVAVANGRIVAVGGAGEVEQLRDPHTEVLDLRGQCLLPGFHDAHQHQLASGLALKQIDAARASSLRDLKELVRARAEATPVGEWILGHGYDDMRLAERRHPTRFDLDEVSPHHPVALTRVCGHVLAANSLALRRAGLDDRTVDPHGGRLDREPDGSRPSGVLFDAAMEPVLRAIPPVSLDQRQDAILAAGRANLRLGITSVWEPGLQPEEIEAYRGLSEGGQLPLRTTVAQNLSPEMRWEQLSPSFLGDWLSLRALKLYADGSLGARTAALSEPYSDSPSCSGLLRWPEDRLGAAVATAASLGWQVAVHAIGDRAISVCLDAFESASRGEPRPERRHRIEHCALLPPFLKERLVNLGVIPVPQPAFLYFKGDGYRERLGAERARRLYPVRSLLQSGAILPGSSDHPCLPDHNPLLGIQAAVTRRTSAGRLLAPEERVSVIDALRMYTLGSAYACGEEGIKGSLSPGRLADMVVLAEDVTRVPAKELATVPVTMTFVGGTLAWSLR